MTHASQFDVPKRQRELSDCSHDYLVERVVNDELYINELVQVLGQFFPFLGPAINEVGESAMARHAALDKKYPVSGLILPKH